MSKPNKPTLLYPVGGETIKGREVKIEWEIPVQSSSVFYEVFYSEYYDSSDEPNWKKIATVPSRNFYVWKIGNLFKTNIMKVAVRAMNANGQRSSLSVSSFFSVLSESPSTPVVLSPIKGNRYNGFVDIVFDDSSIINDYSARSKYAIFFKSNKANIPITPIAQNLPIGTGNLRWDATKLPPSDDYEIIAYLVDDNGNKSQQASIPDLNIVNEGFFLVDTVAPSTYIQINDGDQYTKNNDVFVRVFSYDETTSPHSIRFAEVTENGEEFKSPNNISEIKTLQLSSEEGLKTLTALVQDYAGNRTSEEYRSFRDIINSPIADIAIERATFTASPDTRFAIDFREVDKMWLAVNDSPPSVYKIDNQGLNKVVELPDNILSIALYDESLYVSIENDNSVGSLYKVSQSLASEVLSLNESGSDFISMASLDNVLYLGSSSGDLYAYDLTSISIVQSFDKPVSFIFSDNSILYIGLRNDSNIYTYDGETLQSIGLNNG